MENPDEVFRNVQSILQKIGIRNARRLGIMLERGQHPTQTDLRAASEGTIMLRIRPDV